MNAATTVVTTCQPFDVMYDDPLFCVNAGVSVSETIERAADLMLYAEALATADALPDKNMESGLIQHLTHTANALLKASGVQAKGAGLAKP